VCYSGVVTLAVVHYIVNLPNPILHINTKHIKTSSPLYSKDNRKNDIKVIYVRTQEQVKQFYETFRKAHILMFEKSIRVYDFNKLLS
jgi:hypothetical protein